MRAVQVTRLDGPDAVEVNQIDEPGGDGGTVVVEVHAAGVTYPDVLLTRGEYQFKPDLPFVPGSEVAGLVRSAPEDSRFRPGDRVAAFPAFGGFAETVAVDPRLVFPLPEEVGFAAGAGLPMNYLTVHFALIRRGRLQPQECVLVHGAGGGVGTASIQLARAYGARVIAVVSSEAKADAAREAGADEVVTADGFKDQVAALTEGRGVDVVVDPVGGDRFTDSLRSLAPEGRLLVIGFTGGEIPTVKVNRLLLNNTAVIGVAWGAHFLRDMDYPAIQWSDLAHLIRNGDLRPVLGSSHPLEDAAEALRELDERRATGKVLLEVR